MSNTMTKEKLWNMVLDDYLNGGIYEPNTMIKDLITLLEPEAVEEFARMWGYFELVERG